MREIKFRGFNYPEGWIYGSLLKRDDFPDKPPTYEIFGKYNDFWEVATKSIGQYTGVNDCEGKEIYEGDLLQIPLIKSVRLVEYFDGAFLATHEGVAKIYLSKNHTGVYGWKIIGNIHDNPDLLK